MFQRAVLLLACTFLFLPDAIGQKNDSAVSIIDAGIQSSEDAPFVSAGYRFLPGDFVHATFTIANYTSKKANAEAASTVSLGYTATLEDAAGVPMASPESGVIESELASEDKNWTPKRRVMFTLPSFVSAGRAQLHLVVEDRLAHSQAERRLPVLIGGVTVPEGQSLGVQSLHFFRKESDSQPLELPAYSPGDPIFAKFNMIGFKVGDKNAYRLVYDVLVLRPDGKPFIQEPHAAELRAESFYPAQFLPGNLQLTTSADSAKGKYTLVLTIHDLIANTTAQGRTFFTLE